MQILIGIRVIYKGGRSLYAEVSVLKDAIHCVVHFPPPWIYRN